LRAYVRSHSTIRGASRWLSLDETRESGGPLVIEGGTTARHERKEVA
jgi:hypothetical protein